MTATAVSFEAVEVVALAALAVADAAEAVALDADSEALVVAVAELVSELFFDDNAAAADAALSFAFVVEVVELAAAFVAAVSEDVLATTLASFATIEASRAASDKPCAVTLEFFAAIDASRAVEAVEAEDEDELDDDKA